MIELKNMMQKVSNNATKYRSKLSKEKRFGDVFFDMHMMVAQPDTWIEPMKDAGADQYTFHIEATTEPRQTCRKIREAGMRVGIGLKPNTSVEVIKEYIELANMILILPVEPGTKHIHPLTR